MAASSASAAASTPLRVLLAGDHTTPIARQIHQEFKKKQYHDRLTLHTLALGSNLTVDEGEEFLTHPAATSTSTSSSCLSGAELVDAMTGIDVVIATLRHHQLDEQFKLISAARSANVRWFVPSEFAFDLTAIESLEALSVVNGASTRIAVLNAIQSAGLDYTIFNAGIFGESLLTPSYGVDLLRLTITAPGSFETKVNVTPIEDAAAQLADAIITGRGRNKIIYTGVQLSYGEIASAIERMSGARLRRCIRTITTALPAYEHRDCLSQIHALYASHSHLAVTWPASATYAAQHDFSITSFDEFLDQNLAPLKLPPATTVVTVSSLTLPNPAHPIPLVVLRLFVLASTILIPAVCVFSSFGKEEAEEQQTQDLHTIIQQAAHTISTMQIM